VSLLPAFGPPNGVGCYARDHSVDELIAHGWAFVCLNGERTDAEEKARALRARGVRVFFWSGPGAWRPASWGGEITRLVALCKRTGAHGFIADPEMYWDGVRDGANVGAAFGRALASAADEGLSVGLTSYPLWKPDVLRAVGEAGRGKVWFTPQIYGRSALEIATREGRSVQSVNNQWWTRWTAVGGAGMTIPSVAGWVSTSELGTPQGFARYLAELPKAQGAIAFLTAGGGPPAHILAGLRAYNPAGNVLAQGALAARGFASSRNGQLALALLALIVAVAALAAWKGARA
jgi:hypothetical protein